MAKVIFEHHSSVLVPQKDREPDPHLYFQAPGGQCLRLVGIDEDMSFYEGAGAGPDVTKEKERVTLQESDNRVNQIGEQNRKGKNNDDRPRDIDDGQRQRKEEDCKQYARRTTVGKNHKSPQVGAQESVGLAL